jgi:hypothetical protein
MRKQVSFAIAAATLSLTALFWTITTVVQTARAERSKAIASTYRVIQVQPNAYLSIKPMEPVY